MIQHFGCELFDYPPYRPDLATKDYLLFFHLKLRLGRQQFEDKELKTAAVNSFKFHAVNFYAEKLKKWTAIM